MSWSFTAKSTHDEIDAAIDVAQESPPCEAPEAREQLAAARKAAKELTRVVGVGTIAVTASGHANPGHRPPDDTGYSRDLVTVSVASVA
jgi:hypothetical protein